MFYPGSPRAVTTEQAQGDRAAVTGLGVTVGLFGDASAEQVEAVLHPCRFTCCSFTALSRPHSASGLGDPIFKAVAMEERRFSEGKRPVHSASALLLDSAHDGQFGGTGATFDWSRVLPEVRDRVVLAGGLSADNVAAAVAQVRPVAVDVSSGVERSQGIKDRAKIEAFVRAAREAG